MLERIVRELWSRGELSHPHLQDYFVAFNNRANVSLVLFDRQTEERLLFLKVSDLRDFLGVHAAMQRVQSLVNDMLPEPVCAFELGVYQILVTKAYRLELLAGHPRLNVAAQRLCLDNAVDKLVQLHCKTTEGEIIVDADYAEQVLRPMARKFFEQWPNDELQLHFERHLESVCADSPLSVPRIPQHSDLGAFNTALVAGDPEHVLFIDWDSYGDVDLAGLDAVTLLASFAGVYGDGLYGTSRSTASVVEAAGRYCDGVGMDRAALSLLWPVFWLQYATVKLDIGVRAGQQVAYHEIKRFLTQRDRFLLA